MGTSCGANFHHTCSVIPLLPRHTQRYCGHLLDVANDDEMGEGCRESAASVTWPLDGSAAAGIDVWRHMGRVSLRYLLPIKLPAAMLRCEACQLGTPGANTRSFCASSVCDSLLSFVRF